MGSKPLTLSSTLQRIGHSKGFTSLLAQIQPSVVLMTIALCIVAVSAWWFTVDGMFIKIAWQGFSPFAWVYTLCHPQQFLLDFPGGTQLLEKSAWMNIYPWAYQVLHIPPEALLAPIIGIEIILMAWVMVALTRTLFPQCNWITASIVAILAISSFARDMDMARFAQPSFYGQYYTVADFLRLFALICFLKNKSVWSGFLLGLCFMVHPTMAIMGSLVLLAMFISTPSRWPQKSVWLGCGIYVALSALWYGLVLREPQVAQNFPPQTWLNWTQLNSMHWYPVQFGVFTVKHTERLIPFLSFTVLLALSFGRFGSDHKQDKQVLAGLAMCSLLTLLGILFSWLGNNPTLIKLALHRANDLFILLSLPYVVVGLWHYWQSSGRWLTKLFSLLLLLSPFVQKPGYPYFITLLLVISMMDTLQTPFMFKHQSRVVWALCSVIALLLGTYFVLGIHAPHTIPTYFGSMALWIIAAVVLLYLLICHSYNLKQAKPWVPSVFLLFCLLLGALYWQIQQQPTPEFKAKAETFKAAQLWAKANTPASSLFLVDPTIYYGWRDYAQRSSFGNVREWTYHWAYTSDYALYQEGMKRLREFGIQPERYITETPRIKGFRKLLTDLRTHYYTVDDHWRLRMAKQYRIAYFVLMKKYLPHPLITRFSISYENADFIILATPTEVLQP